MTHRTGHRNDIDESLCLPFLFQKDIHESVTEAEASTTRPPAMSLNIFLTTWNTGLQGSKAQSQDLTSWLLPVLHKTATDPELPSGQIPDIYAIAVQELLPVHLARRSRLFCYVAHAGCIFNR
jgi:hypothetical protein